eukprot:gnl/TRDRNA2_/TRDRNA2_90152_c1_seq1.p1 gnl/TRDRNA2_/TRDRNA2_90152_c1~~gnl/TRDRNA2_/TRDRNA2_90152_c1_seq1.p1  ORF type:complete len:212 (-),score=20.19 gnl/TRDRNA2_/TRDRNA2_90152_c1_seq1:10-624(-)
MRAFAQEHDTMLLPFGPANYRRLDELVNEPVQLLKLDIEGHELWALEGAAALFENWGVEHVLFEFTAAALQSQGASALSLLEFFAERNYSLYVPAYGVDSEFRMVTIWQPGACTDANLWYGRADGTGYWAPCIQDKTMCDDKLFHFACPVTCGRCQASRREWLNAFLGAKGAANLDCVLAVRSGRLPSGLRGAVHVKTVRGATL